MKFGVYVPNCWAYGSVAKLTRLAREAEAAGWEGFFIWDHLVLGDEIPVADAHTALASIALSTAADGPIERIGALITPLARRRPWKVARETVALQELAGGRLVVGAGLGEPPSYEISNQELGSPRERGAALDDALELLELFWQGAPVSWRGSAAASHTDREPASVDAPPFLPVPDPTPPIWIAGCVYRERPATEQPRRPFRRAARHAGLFPVAMPWDNRAPLTPRELERAVRLAFSDAGPPEGYEVVTCGRTHGAGAPVSPEQLSLYGAAGATWWLEAPEDLATFEQALEAVVAGPPSMPVPGH